MMTSTSLHRFALIASSMLALLAAPSAVAAHVGFTAPASGDAYEPGEPVMLVWEIEIAHTLQNWDLEFSADGGGTYTDVAIDLSPATLTYTWTVPDTECSSCILRVTMDNAGTDYTAELAFSIMRGTTPADAGGTGGVDGGVTDAGPAVSRDAAMTGADAGPGDTGSGGCAVASARSSALAWPLALALLALTLRRRERSRG